MVNTDNTSKSLFSLREKAVDGHADATSEMLNGTNEEKKDDIISEAIRTDYGLQMLGKAMQEPITIALGYQSIARKLLLVDEIPEEGKYYKYGEHKIPHIQRVGKHDGGLLVSLDDWQMFSSINNEEFSLDEFVLPNSEQEHPSYNDLDHLQKTIKNYILEAETASVLSALRAACGKNNTFAIPELTIDDIKRATNSVETVCQHDAAKIVVNPQMFKKIKKSGWDCFGEACQRDTIMTGLYGRLLTMDIHISSLIPVDEIVIVGEAGEVGVTSILDPGVSVKVAKDDHNIRFYPTEKFGCAVLKNEGVSIIKVAHYGQK